MGGYLREIGSRAPSQLLQIVSTSRPALTKEVIAALGSHPDRRVVLLLAAFKGNWDSSIKQEAIKALGRSADPGALRILNDFLADENEEIRVFTANNIRSLDDKAILDAVKSVVQAKAFHQRSLQERQAYLDLIARQKKWETHDLLRDILSRRSGLLRSKRRTATRLAVVQTLERTGGPLSRELLEEGSRMKGRKVRKACRNALQNLPPGEAKPAAAPEKKNEQA
jgi:HEAT repeat protein